MKVEVTQSEPELFHRRFSDFLVFDGSWTFRNQMFSLLCEGLMVSPELQDQLGFSSWIWSFVISSPELDSVVPVEAHVEEDLLVAERIIPHLDVCQLTIKTWESDDGLSGPPILNTHRGKTVYVCSHTCLNFGNFWRTLCRPEETNRSMRLSKVTFYMLFLHLSLHVCFYMLVFTCLFCLVCLDMSVFFLDVHDLVPGTCPLRLQTPQQPVHQNSMWNFCCKLVLCFKWMGLTGLSRSGDLVNWPGSSHFHSNRHEVPFGLNGENQRKGRFPHWLNQRDSTC